MSYVEVADIAENASASEHDAEEKPAEDEYTLFGMDLKPLLPSALGVSTLASGVCMINIQVPLICEAFSLAKAPLTAFFCVLYGATLGWMLYSANTDPGQISPEVDVEKGPPRRAHHSWQYERPIRRYDHFCKWLKNVIGLANHREFFLMILSLVAIAVLSMIIDLFLAIILIAERGIIRTEILLAIHLLYSAALFTTVGPIAQIHVGLISRNELAYEWKQKHFYVANKTSKGDNVPVEELDDEEYNDLFDRGQFLYDASKNPYDRGCCKNWIAFFCQPRWGSAAEGEF